MRIKDLDNLEGHAFIDATLKLWRLCQLQEIAFRALLMVAVLVYSSRTTVDVLCVVALGISGMSSIWKLHAIEALQRDKRAEDLMRSIFKPRRRMPSSLEN